MLSVCVRQGSLTLSNTYLAMEFKLDAEGSEDMTDGMSKDLWSR